MLLVKQFTLLKSRRREELISADMKLSVIGGSSYKFSVPVCLSSTTFLDLSS